MSHNIKNSISFQQLRFNFRKLMQRLKLIFPSKKLLFKLSSQTSFYDGYNKNLPFDEKYHHRPNTKPSADKQTHLKEKQSTKEHN